MNEHEQFYEDDDAVSAEAAPTADTPLLPIFPWPPRLRVSGLYTAPQIKFPPIPIPTPIPVSPIPIPQPSSDDQFPAGLSHEVDALSSKIFRREELRLDVDGRYPQMTASGTISGSLAKRVHWIAKLTATGTGAWSGSIWYKDGDVSTLFPYTTVDISASGSLLPTAKTATVRFYGGGTAVRTRIFKYKSPYFRRVEFEFDSATGVTATTSINTHAHPNRPATLPNETLSIETVYRRAGFDVKRSGDSIVPIAGAGSNAQWSDNEMHDAMQVYWSRFSAKAQWSLWVLFASQHEQGTSLGGIMFDDIGPNHRQGTAMFNDSFISTPPAGDAAPAAWIQRMRFWTACHEMGHAFNLAHSWQKSHPPDWGTPWIPLLNEPEARSFMNYPYNVSGGQTAFFADFAYQFSDNELLFMRHAPERFVQMGNANWFDHHGFEQANRSPEPALKLNLRVDRATAMYQFLEPVVLELKLTNISSRPVVIEKELLSMTDHMTVIIKKRGKEARQYIPFASYCYDQQARALMPGDFMTDSLFVSVGRNGWDIAEPGYYTIQIALHMETEDIVSDPLTIRVAPPRGYDEEFLSQDFFSEVVGRILNFDGSQALRSGNDTLREVCDRLSDRAVSTHARIALAAPLAQEYKALDLGDRTGPILSAKDAGGRILMTPAKLEEAKQLYSDALLDKKDRAISTLGRTDYEHYLGRFSRFLEGRGAVPNKDAKDSRRESKREKSSDVDRILRVVKETLSELKEHVHSS
ncbi:MAG: hypothetical protein H8K04_02110 [Nitrospira sp.]